MPVRNQNWYDLQEGRRYPLDDFSTGIDDNGEPIADNIIVDCHIRFPNTLGEYAFLTAINVSNTIVTVLISAANDINDTTTFKPIAAVSITKPLQLGVNQPITPLVPGVAGWIVFGSGVGVNFSGKYSSPIQTLIAARCARPYRPLPIPTLGKINLDTALSGLVKVLGRTPVVATYEITDVDGEQVPAIVFRLTGDLATYNPLKEYGGPCKARPESDTCVKLGLQNINGVQPDCDGNIEITASGFTLLPFVDENGSCGGGFDLITARGLKEACADGSDTGKRYRDLCVPYDSNNSDSLPYWPNPVDQIPLPPDVVSSISLGDPDYFGSCYPNRTCFDFTAGFASAFLTRVGLFVFDEIIATDDLKTCETENSSDSASAQSSDSPDTGLKYVYAAADISGINVAVLRDCNSVNTITTCLRLAAGPRRNGGVVLNYTPPNPSARSAQKFIAVLLDVDTGGLQIVRYNGNTFVVEARVNFSVTTNVWYEIEATVQQQLNGVLVSATAREVSNNANTVSLSTVVSQFGSITGSVGLCSSRAFTHFSKFTIGD